MVVSMRSRRKAEFCGAWHSEGGIQQMEEGNAPHAAGSGDESRYREEWVRSYGVSSGSTFPAPVN